MRKPFIVPILRLIKFFVIVLCLAGCQQEKSERSHYSGDKTDASSTAVPVLEENNFSQLNTKPAFYDEVVVFSAGVSVFDESRNINSLPEAANDAKRIANYFSKKFAYNTSPLLVDKAATKQGILDGIKNTIRMAGEGGAAIIYLATHGYRVVKSPADIGTGYIVPYGAKVDGKDLDPKKWAAECIAIKELVDIAKSARCKHVLMMLDCCCSGLAVTRGGDLLQRADLQQLALTSSRYILAATTKDGEAIDGVFVQSLLETLDAYAPGECSSVTELFANMRRDLVSRSKRTMIPQLGKIGKHEGEFVFIPKSVGQDQIKMAVERTLLSSWRSRGQSVDISDLSQILSAENYRFSRNSIEPEKYWVEQLTKFSNSASLSDEQAMVAVFLCHLNGLGVERDKDVAFEWAQRLYERDSAAGRYAMGVCLADGIGVEQNTQSGRKLLQEAADAGYILADSALGASLIRSAKPTKASLERCMVHFERAAQGGIARAHARIAQLHSDFQVEGWSQNLELARLHCRKAIDANGDAIAKYLLGALLLKAGEELEAGRKLVIEAADAGHSAAQQFVGAKIFDGALGFPSNPDLAVEYLENSARQSHPGGLTMLGHLYGRTENSPFKQDRKKAVMYVTQAMEQGFAPAYFAMAQWQSGGLVVDLDFEKSLDNFKRAAQLGHGEAFWWTGKMCWEHLGITPVEHPFAHRPNAVHWYCRGARDFKDRSCLEFLDEFAQNLRKEETSGREIPDPKMSQLTYSPVEIVESLKAYFPNEHRYLMEHIQRVSVQR